MRFISSLLLLPALALATLPPPGEITIKSVTHSGNGCPQGSTSTIMNEDRTVRSPSPNHSFQPQSLHLTSHTC